MLHIVPNLLKSGDFSGDESSPSGGEAFLERLGNLIEGKNDN
jgi:hypothetical protein